MLLVGCSSKEMTPKNLPVTANVKGEWIDENTYKNEFFKMTFKSPKGWILQKTMPSADHLIDDSSRGRAVKEAMEKTHNPLSVTRHQAGGANYNIVIENVSRLNIETIDEYIKVALDSLDVMKLDFKVVKKEKKLNYLGAEWSSVQLETRVGDKLLYQRMYGMLKGGNVLLLNITSALKEDSELYAAIESSISFAK